MPKKHVTTFMVGPQGHFPEDVFQVMSDPRQVFAFDENVYAAEVKASNGTFIRAIMHDHDKAIPLGFFFRAEIMSTTPTGIHLGVHEIWRPDEKPPSLGGSGQDFSPT